MQDFGFAAVPAITVICLLVAQAVKNLIAEDEYKHIPTLCGALGALLGIMCYVLWPGFIPAENGLVAAVIGIVSGWAATGVHQVIKKYIDN